MNRASRNECTVQQIRGQEASGRQTRSPTGPHPVDPSRKATAMIDPTDALTAARAEALFTSDISASSQPSPAEVDRAIRRAIISHGGIRGCAAEVAAAYGDQPETAAPRMRWARGVVETVYAHPPQQLQAA
jgi:hypothetical protein